MDREVIKRVARAIAGEDSNVRSAFIYIRLATAAIAEYEMAKQEAQDAEDERMYTEFHK